MSGRSTSENQPAPASSSSDADAARPGSGAILGGVLLVGAAAGYALIAFRFKSMHAGTRGSGTAEVGSGTPRAGAILRPVCHIHPGVVDLRSRRDFSRLDPRLRRPTLATLVRPRSEDLFAKRSSVSGKGPGLAALVGQEGRWATLSSRFLLRQAAAVL